MGLFAPVNGRLSCTTGIQHNTRQMHTSDHWPQPGKTPARTERLTGMPQDMPGTMAHGMYSSRATAPPRRHHRFP